MNRKTDLKSYLRVSAAAALVITAFGLAGCASHSATTTASAKKAVALPWPLTIHDPAKHQTGAELWAKNCMRCHELRSPAQYRPGEWSVIIDYMRLKAGLTGEQAKKIERFLKESSQGS
jgi:cytochrome c5